MIALNALLHTDILSSVNPFTATLSAATIIICINKMTIVFFSKILFNV